MSLIACELARMELSQVLSQIDMSGMMTAVEEKMRQGHRGNLHGKKKLNLGKIIRQHFSL
jgi:hypothetical protein